MEDQLLLFVWNRLLFVGYIARSHLILSWRGIDSSDRLGNNGDGNSSDNSSSRDDEDFDISTTNLRCKKSNFTETNTTSFDLSKWTDCQLIAARPACDKGMYKQQVLLLKCVNAKNGPANFEYLFIQVRETPSLSNVSEPALESVDFRCRTLQFSLALTQSYSFDISQNLTWNKHLAVFSNLQLLFVHPGSMTVVLCAPDGVSSHGLQLKDSSLAAGSNSISDVEIVDALFVVEDRNIIALVCYKTVGKITECQCLQFSPANCLTSHTTDRGYNMTQISVGVLFAAHYAQILKAASISSFTNTYSLGSKSSNINSSLTMLTQTGYALRFEAGLLKCCVNLTGYMDEVCSDSWNQMFVKVVSFDGCPDRAAVQVKSTCHLIDWTTEKVVKSWQSVFTAISSDVHLHGLSSLALVFQPETADSPETTTSDQLLQDSVVAVFDVDDVFGDHAYNAVMLDSGITLQGGQQCAEDSSGSQSLCAANALVDQQRQCQQAVSEMESQLKDKLTFLSDMWQQFTGLDVSSDNHLSHTTSPNQLSLTPLVEGCLPAQARPGHRHQGRKHLETGALWKRLVDLLLVVGVQVRNVSLSQLRDVQINLVLAAHCQTRIVETMFKRGLESLQESTDQAEFERHDMLPPGSSTVITCVVDISGAVCAHDLVFHTFISYSVLNLDSSLEVSRGRKISVREVEECCAQVVVTPCQLLDDLFCLGGSRDLAAVTLTSTDLLALDCIHQHWTLLVQTVVSSLSSLALRLSQDPRLRFLQWADQFLFVDSPALKYCRLQLLKPSTRCNSSIQVFARSHSQALLVVTFLYSILPEDVTIIYATSHGRPEISHISAAVLEDVECKISATKQRLTTASSSHETDISVPLPPGTSDGPSEGSLSPKFLSSKRQAQCKAAGPAGPGGEAHVQTSVSDSSRLAGGTKEMSDVGTEKQRFRVARKRFRDIWGDDDSP